MRHLRIARPRFINRTRVAAMTLGVLSCAPLAHAGTWIGPLDGSWSAPANWHDGIVPPEGGSASIVARGLGGADPDLHKRVVYDGFYLTTVSVSTGATGWGIGTAGSNLSTVTITQSGPGTRLVTSSLSLCGNNRGTVAWNQNAGTVIIHNDLRLGAPSEFRTFVAGSYGLGGGFLSAGSIVMGSESNFATASFAQSGGTLNTAGVDVRSTGSYAMSAGAADIQGNMNVRGFATFSGGHASVSGNLATSGSDFFGRITLAAGQLDVGGTVRVESGGRFEQTGGALRAGALSITASTARFDAGPFSVGTLDVGSGGQFVMGTGANNVARTRSLAVASDGMMDIGEGAVVVDYTGASPLQSIRALILSGHNDGSWNGNGIRSAFANSSTHGVGYAEAAELGAVPAVFGTIDNTAVLLRLTRYGDADLSGSVNLADFNRLAGSFGAADTTWSRGDFNYDGTTNLADFNLLAANFGLSASGTRGVSPDDWAALARAVPEPIAAPSCLVAATLCARRHRRHSR